MGKEKKIRGYVTFNKSVLKGKTSSPSAAFVDIQAHLYTSGTGNLLTLYKRKNYNHVLMKSWNFNMDWLYIAPLTVCACGPADRVCIFSLPRSQVKN